MNIFYWIYTINVALFTIFYIVGGLAVEKESKDTWGDAKTMEMEKSTKLSEEWEKNHPVLDFFQSFYYEVGRKIEIPGDTYRAIKYFIQRGKRGYSDCDIWGFDSYLSNIIVNGLKDLKEQLHGVPCGLTGTQAISLDDNDDTEMKEWKRIIEEIIWTFKATQHIQDREWFSVEDEKNRTQLVKFVKILNKKDNGLFKDLPQTKHYLMTKKDMTRYEQGWKYFKQYYFSLWD